MADTSHDDDDDVSSSGGDSVVDGPRRRRRGRAGRFRMDADGESEDVGSVNDDSNNKDGESTSDTSSTTESSSACVKHGVSAPICAPSRRGRGRVHFRLQRGALPPAQHARDGLAGQQGGVEGGGEGV